MSSKKNFPPLNGVKRVGLVAAGDDDDKTSEAINSGNFGYNVQDTSEENTFSPVGSFAGELDDYEEGESTATESGHVFEDVKEEGLNIDDSSSENEVDESGEAQAERLRNEITEEERQEIAAFTKKKFNDARLFKNEEKETLLEKSTKATELEENVKTTYTGGEQMFDKANSEKPAEVIKFQGKKVFKEKPEGYAEENRVKDKDVKGWSKTKFEELLVPEIGNGISKLSGMINVHVSTDAVKLAVLKMIRASVEEAASRGVDIEKEAAEFTDAIVGVVQQTITSGVGKVSIATFADNVFAMIAEIPKMSAEDAKLKAASIVTSYTGANILVLGNNKATVFPAEVLTLVVKKEVVPAEETGAYALLLKAFCNEIRYNDADDDFVRITLALDKIFPYAQGSFKSLDGIKMDSVKLVTTNNILHEVVYTIEKDQK